ncbi:MAG: elongation factor P maturation arginine rhamnosyltransferase EarP [Burkholderiaceae bacterium]|uniref:elongation factor P maturation arginine rhamnosyltransferase EarP n=1 Tax=Hydrogenophaga sp. TaxID=1904254 RepID=UPI002775CAEE|nr:elongation factor P maturation arginine rhamnosyltransferase EarP [Hydrogenophaga sp.]MDP2066782.1 elongation factor P maturation arginine rhamnosyltransferase EarP [Burkholderiaceae bacterium]MDZ4397765.1 elongation factor P maturation arginine rhamnosyltransferase EarP [Hydrogenophaga sp.]
MAHAPDTAPLIANATTTATATHAPLRWDIFCRVIDNHGDLGVCWRLAADLAARGETVRLWVDDASALDWMAPGARQGTHPGVRVLPWRHPIDPTLLAALPVADVWVEAFGCEISPEFIANHDHFTGASGKKSFKNPVWINLEYLSAEPYVERSHGLPSPVLSGPGRGRTKWFFYPGFTPATGGLLHEPDLAARQAAFDRTAWLAAHGIPWQGERLISLFCYEPPALAAWLAQLARGPEPTRLLVTHGRAAAAVRAAIFNKIRPDPASNGDSSLLISYLPALTQRDYDALLWACDLNLVRGEDSWVRALLAGRPMVWQAYPQDDGAHHAKLQAWLDWLGASPSQRAFHQLWNAPQAPVANAPWPALDGTAWQPTAQAARSRLLAQDDLCTQLIRFVAKTR